MNQNQVKLLWGLRAVRLPSILPALGSVILCAANTIWESKYSRAASVGSSAVLCQGLVRWRVGGGGQGAGSRAKGGTVSSVGAEVCLTHVAGLGCLLPS